jgi:glycosyltransferase involved in cell wall biosynthesis
MATGLPVVATAIDGSAEAVEDAVNGLRVPPGEPQVLGQAVITLLRDPDLARRMGQAGLERAVEFDVGTMVAKIAELYQQLLRQKKYAVR